MKRTSTFLGLMLLLTTVVSGQTSDEKNKSYRINNPLEALKRGSMNNHHPLSLPINKKPAQSSFLQSTLANKQRLDSTIMQVWNDTISQWVNSINDEFTYDSIGNVIQENLFEWDGSQWMNDSKAEYIYNSNGNRTLMNHYLWNGSQWEQIIKIEYSYDSMDNPTQVLSYQWDGNQWNNNIIIKDEYTYDSTRQMTQHITTTWNGFSWSIPIKTEFTWDSNGKQTQWINYSMDGNQWVNSSKYEYIYDSLGNQTQGNEYSWDGSQWVYSAKSEYSYDSNGNQIQSSDYYLDGINWMGLMKYERTFDNSYPVSDLVWPPYLTYNNMLTSELIYFWDNITNDWSRDHRHTYYYSEQDVTNVTELKKGEFIVYPNPVTEMVSINYSGNYSPITFELFDIQGRRLLSREIKSNVTISLKGFQNGMYLYLISIDGKKQSGKLLKE